MLSPYQAAPEAIITAEKQLGETSNCLLHDHQQQPQIEKKQCDDASPAILAAQQKEESKTGPHTTHHTESSNIPIKMPHIKSKRKRKAVQSLLRLRALDAGNFLLQGKDSLQINAYKGDEGMSADKKMPKHKRKAQEGLAHLVARAPTRLGEPPREVNTTTWDTFSYDEYEDDLYYEHRSSNGLTVSTQEAEELWQNIFSQESMRRASHNTNSRQGTGASMIRHLSDAQFDTMHAMFAVPHQFSDGDVNHFFVNEEFRNPNVVPQPEGRKNILYGDRKEPIVGANPAATVPPTPVKEPKTRSRSSTNTAAAAADNAEWAQGADLADDEDFDINVQRSSRATTTKAAKRKRQRAKPKSGSTAKIPWSEEELRALFKGFNKYPRNWRKIQAHDGVLLRRTAISIKEKYRKTMVKAWEGDMDLRQLIGQYIDYEQAIIDDNIAYSATQYRKRLASKRKRPVGTPEKSRKRGKK